jgi:hypothetical protein
LVPVSVSGTVAPTSPAAGDANVTVGGGRFAERQHDRRHAVPDRERVRAGLGVGYVARSSVSSGRRRSASRRSP